MVNVKLNKLKALKEKWKRRRERLRKKASDFAKNRSVAENERSMWIEHGRFGEIDKCMDELTAIINKMEQESK